MRGRGVESRLEFFQKCIRFSIATLIIRIITNLILTLNIIFLTIKTTGQVTYRLRERLDASPRPTSLGAPPSKAPTRLPAMGAPVGSIGKLAQSSNDKIIIIIISSVLLNSLG